jgi:hypothetical protein
MDRRTEISDPFTHAGAGTSVALAWVGLIPGVFPFLALTVLAGAVLVVPFLALGLVAAIIAAPPHAAWRFIGWGRRRRMSACPGRPGGAPEQAPGPAHVAAPYSGIC